MIDLRFVCLFIWWAGFHSLAEYLQELIHQEDKSCWALLDHYLKQNDPAPATSPTKHTKCKDTFPFQPTYVGW